MTTRHHIQRIVSSIILVAVCIFGVLMIESWFWLGVLCYFYLFIAWIIIEIDLAHGIHDDEMKL